MRPDRTNTHPVLHLALLAWTSLAVACADPGEATQSPETTLAETSTEEVASSPTEGDAGEGEGEGEGDTAASGRSEGAEDTTTPDAPEADALPAPLNDTEESETSQGGPDDTAQGPEPEVTTPGDAESTESEESGDEGDTESTALEDSGDDGDTESTEVADTPAEGDTEGAGSGDAEALGDALDEDTEDAGPDADPGCPACGPSEASATYPISPEALTPALERTRHNPLKGFITSYAWSAPNNALADQMEFLYLPMREVWGPDGETFDLGLEPHLEAAKARSHHVVLRVYIDYPNKASGLPDYLAELVPCTPYSDHGGGCSPDYDHPEMTSAMLGLIAALGERYDADPRLGVIQLGLLGFWGEWHTWPYPDWFPSLETQEAILTAYDAAFQVTELQARRAAANAVSLRIGYHDDSFAYSTLGDIGWFFWPGLIAAGADARWEEVMMGGELRPELQATIFEEGYTLDTYAQDFNTCVETTHASYMLNYQGFSGEGTGYEGAELEAAEAAALLMGYTFELTTAAMSLSGLHQGQITAALTLEVTQSGVAPFYYPLFLGVGHQGADDIIMGTEDLSTLLPGETRALTIDLGTIPVTALGEAMTLHLMSDMLLEGQELRLATQTIWDSSEGPTTLSWELGCQVGEVSYALGEALESSAGACPCICDLDGMKDPCTGAPCP